MPRLIHGDLPPGCPLVLAWGETDTVARLRERASVAQDASTWRSDLWHLASTAFTAAACNHRQFGFAVAEQLGVCLPGSRWLQSVTELEVHLQQTELGHQDAWVLKAPHSASGRVRLRRRGRVLDGEATTRARRLFGKCAALLFEPWVERVADFGCSGLIDSQGPRVFSPHSLTVSQAGVFESITIHGRGDRTGLDSTNRNLILHAAEVAGHALHRVGYRGPYGIDAFIYRDPAGHSHLQPLCEINARMTFGLLARAWSEMTEKNHRSARLTAALGSPPPGALPLLLPGPDDPTSLWLEFLQ